MLSCFSHVQLFAILWTAVHQAALSMEFSRQEYWSGLPFPIPGDLPNPGLEPMSLMSPALVGGFFTTNTTWCFKPVIHHPSNSDSSVQSLCHVQLFATPWTAAHWASLSITNSQSLLKLMSIELVMPSNHLMLCRPLLLMASIFPSIRVFSNESALRIRWPKYWSFSFKSVLPTNTQD